MNAIQKARALLAGDASHCPQTVIADLLAHIEDCALTRPMPEGVEANHSADFAGALVIGKDWRVRVPRDKVYRCNGDLVIYVQWGAD